MNRDYPGAWQLELEDCRSSRDAVITRVRIELAGSLTYAISFFRIRDGRISGATEFFADVVEPPCDRSRWAARY